MGLLIKDILKIGETRLERAGIFNFKTDAAELFCYLYNIERNKLFMSWSKSVDDNGAVSSIFSCSTEGAAGCRCNT